MSTSVKANRSAVLNLGEQLRNILHGESKLIRDRKYHLRTYKECFVGGEMVDWLIDRGEVSTREEGVEVMQKLLDYGVIHHVVDDHCFKDEKLFYRFRRDDGTYQGPPDPPIVAKGQRIYSRVKVIQGFIADRKYHLQSYKKCFVGNEFVEWLVSCGECGTREDASELGRHLLEAGVIRHVCNDHHFKDDYLFYRFVNDETSPKSIKERLGMNKSSRKDSRKSSKPVDSEDGKVYDEIGATSPATGDENNYEKMTPRREFTEDSYVLISRNTSLGTKGEDTTSEDLTESSQSNWDRSASIRSDSSVIGRVPSWSELLSPSSPYAQKELAVTSDAVGFGFIIRGRGPVYVHTVDDHGPAAAAGMTVGEFLLEVNGVDVKKATHKEVAQIILQGTSTAYFKTLCAHSS
jgi:hypothetical protein